MEPGTSLRISQPRSAEKRLRKRKELDALVSNMYTKVRSSGGNGSSLGASNPARGSAARQLLGAKYSSESDSEKFAALEDDDEVETISISAEKYFISYSYSFFAPMCTPSSADTSPCNSRQRMLYFKGN